jgi:ParB family chromosome partitioning protein
MKTNPRLGRGLAALMGDAPSVSPQEGGASGGNVQTMSIDALEPGPFQPRRNMAPGAMSELVESIKARGILQPLLTRRDPKNGARYQIIAGERRWRAAQAAGLHEVPVLVRDLSDQEAMAASLVENLQRQDLNPIEEAEGYKRLLEEFGLTQEQLGAAVGKSRSHIANTIRLLQLPERVLAEVQSGTLSAGHARALLAHANPEEAARQVIAGGLNVRQTEALATNRSPGSTATVEKPRPRDPETEALERDISERLGLKVQIAFDGKGGTVRIHYLSLDQLDGLIAVLSR